MDFNRGKEIIEVRTDLALETQERFRGTDTEVSGVSLEEKSLSNGEIIISCVKILNKHGEKVMKKPIGNYITIEAIKLREPDDSYHKDITKVLAEILSKLVKDIKNKKILVVGLGNREATPDALGPQAISNIRIGEKIYAISPGVMAQTGMETADFVKAVVNEMKPDAVIAIDALAARNTRRLNSTIQVSDTGISPGSGVGNHRHEINEKSLGIPVVAIGIPTVVDAATIVNDALDGLIDALSQSDAFKNLKDSMDLLNDNEKFQLIKELMEPAGGDLYVTPKDIDENVKALSFTISEAINMALF